MADAVFIERFWRNRKGEAVTVEIKKLDEGNVIDVRIWFTDRDGILKPSNKGICCSIRKLPDLARVITRAAAVARILD